MDHGEEFRRFRLHFEGPLTRSHTLPSSALVQSLQQLQRIVHLLVMAESGREIRQRARVTRDIEREFPLVCGVPEEGGWALPVQIGNSPQYTLIDSPALDIAKKTNALISAVNAGDVHSVNKLIPDSYYRKNIISAFRAMIPAQRSGIIINIEDYKNNKILNDADARKGIEKLSVRSDSDLNRTLAFVTGSLIEMKFQERRLRLQLLNSGRALDASYGDDFEPILLGHPRDLIQVHGNIVYDESGIPSSISDVDEILEVDDSPIYINSIEVEDKTYNATEQIIFDVSFDKEYNLYKIDGDFDIIICAETRKELESELYSELIMLWNEYAIADKDTLTDSACSLRDKLLKMFREFSDVS